MTTKNNLYTQAETVYRQYFSEEERIYRAGGITEPSKALLETTTGDYLKNAMAVFRNLHEIGATAVGGTYKLAWVKRAPGVVMSGSIVALKVCADTSSIRMGSSGRPSKPGLIIEETGYFVRDGHSLKLTASQYQKVSKC